MTMVSALSPEGCALIKSFEQCRLVAYRPTPNDVPTIGWGATRNADGSAVKMGEHWTQAEADVRFLADSAGVARSVARLLVGAAATQGQFDALVAFAYNLGVGALAGSTLLRDHRAGRYAEAAAEFPRWNHQGNVVLRGLTRRRAAEAALYLRENGL